MKIPTLKNWIVAMNCLIGQIYDDKSYPDGKTVNLGRLLEIDMVHNLAKTVRGQYVLSNTDGQL